MWGSLNAAFGVDPRGVVRKKRGELHADQAGVPMCFYSSLGIGTPVGRPARRCKRGGGVIQQILTSRREDTGFFCAKPMVSPPTQTT
jgi:hypothetical protein